MTQHFHLITRKSPARTAVRDLQEQARSIRISRTSGVTMRRTANGTHTKEIVEADVRPTTETASNSYWV